MGLRRKDEKRLEGKGASQAALDLQNQGEMGDFRGERGQKGRDLPALIRSNGCGPEIKPRGREVRMAKAVLNLPAIRASFERMM
jgi:hypothetical protein